MLFRSAGYPQKLNNLSLEKIELNKFDVVKKGAKFAIFGVGAFLRIAEDVANLIKEKTGYEATIINPRFLSALDVDLLDKLKEDHDIIVTLEDGIVEGGFGQKIASYYGDVPVKVFNFGAKKEFTNRVSAEKLYAKYNLTPEQILEKIS